MGRFAQILTGTFIVFCLLGSSTAGCTPMVSILEPFVRMRGLAFFNVSFSHSTLKVNETMTVTGKFRMMESWPRMLPEPELSWIGILVPGPKLATRERWINGQFMQNALLKSDDCTILNSFSKPASPDVTTYTRWSTCQALAA